MLHALSIRRIVLIEALDIGFSAGLTVLTGETGAGKSILLDALGLAIGMRADARLLRHGATQGEVVASFTLTDAVRARLTALDLEAEEDGDLIVRRVLADDGRTRAYVNDRPVSLAALREITAGLVEIHGQHDQRGLLDERTHAEWLDTFTGALPQAETVRHAWQDWQTQARALDDARQALERAAGERDYLEHIHRELLTLAPEPDEEPRLAEERTRHMQAEKGGRAVADAESALEEGRGVMGALMTAARHLLPATDSSPAAAQAAQAVDRAMTEVQEALDHLQQAARLTQYDPSGQERVEERLFALRAAARKHRCTVAELPQYAAEIAQRLTALDAGASSLAAQEAAVKAARTAYTTAAAALSAARQEGAQALEAALMGELAALKLGSTRVHVALAALDEANWGPAGQERVTFQVATNPGAPPGPLAKIASGGEMSRFMLALRVVLAGRSAEDTRAPLPTMIFDEVDTGIGGAVADAVGERLARLGHTAQVLVVTHQPQVAAKGTQHLRVRKEVESGQAHTRIEALTPTLRRSELARMLSGADITPEAEAAAARLLGEAA